MGAFDRAWAFLKSDARQFLLDNPPIGGSADAHDAYLHDLIEQDILSEIEKEGGALGMKNLSGIADEQNLNEVLSQMEAAGKIFRHEDGDIYTHEPEGN